MPKPPVSVLHTFNFLLYVWKKRSRYNKNHFSVSSFLQKTPAQHKLADAFDYILTFLYRLDELRSEQIILPCLVIPLGHWPAYVSLFKPVFCAVNKSDIIVVFVIDNDVFSGDNVTCPDTFIPYMEISISCSHILYLPDPLRIH